jgi:hypothetical protein
MKSNHALAVFGLIGGLIISVQCFALDFQQIRLSYSYDSQANKLNWTSPGNGHPFAMTEEVEDLLAKAKNISDMSQKRAQDGSTWTGYFSVACSAKIVVQNDGTFKIYAIKVCQSAEGPIS